MIVHWRHPDNGMQLLVENHGLQVMVKEYYAMPVLEMHKHKIANYDNFYYTRKPWKTITRYFIGQIVHNMGDTLE